MKKLIALLLAVMMVFSLAACGEKAPANAPAEDLPDYSLDNSEQNEFAGKEYGTDYTSLYKKFGKDVSIADVIEDEATGTAFIERDGETYPLGLDFLSRAMVHNTAVPEGGKWETEDDVYAEWWKFYITRWNQLMPEIPLYSNEIFDFVNADIKGIEEFPTNPYWPADKAMIDWTSSKADKSVILGDITDMTGKFRFSNFGSNNPIAADNLVQDLISGLETVVSDINGQYLWNETVVKDHEEIDNEDGSRTFVIKLQKDLKFSDGSPVTAKNYLVYPMVFSTPVATQAAGKDHSAALQMQGFADFNAYTGPESAEGSKELKGLRLIDDYSFSVTIDAQYLPYYYSIVNVSFSPYAMGLFLGEDVDIKDDGNGVYFTDNFYEKNGDKYVLADHIYDGAWNVDDSYPYSGAYTIKEWNEADKSVILSLNPEFKGDYRGHKPAIEKVMVKKIVSETQLEDFKSGGVDVLSGITGAVETDEALRLVEENPGEYLYNFYSRAGYGKLSFRADFGPVQFASVRKAIALCMDRAKFAKDFTGGHGGVVDGPFYTGSWMYKAAVENGMQLNSYATSVDNAIAVLEQGGWIYDETGHPYSGSGVRYKMIPDEFMQERDKTFQSKDGAYKAVNIGDYWFMPLVLNWYGTANNAVSDLLMTGFLENPNFKAAGFAIQNTIGEFPAMLDEMYQAPVSGTYGGVPMYTCFNLATAFTSTVYDFELNLTIDPAEYEDYSIYYLKDTYDIYWL